MIGKMCSLKGREKNYWEKSAIGEKMRLVSERGKCIKTRTDRRTDGPMDGRTNGQMGG